MKRLLLSMAVVFAFSMTSKAQGIVLPGLPDPVDLEVVSFDIPSSVPVGHPIVFTFVVQNNISDIAVAPCQAISSIRTPSGAYDNLTINVPGMSAGQDQVEVTVTYMPPTTNPGDTYTIGFIYVDSGYIINETDEYINNYNHYTRFTPVVLQ